MISISNPSLVTWARTIFRRPLMIILLVSLLASGLAACGVAPELASLELVNTVQSTWQTDPVHSYRIVVQVQRTGERRRHEIHVHKDQIVSATMQYWEENRRRWGELQTLNEQQALPFTVPGLFDTVRNELLYGNRTTVRTVMAGDSPFLQRIHLGPVQVDGEPVSGTEAVLTVLSFESLRLDESFIPHSSSTRLLEGMPLLAALRIPQTDMVQLAP